MRWFYGFKLHPIINNKGELINFKLTKGNVFDNRIIEDISLSTKNKDEIGIKNEVGVRLINNRYNC